MQEKVKSRDRLNPNCKEGNACKKQEISKIDKLRMKEITKIIRRLPEDFRTFLKDLIEEG